MIPIGKKLYRNFIENSMKFHIKTNINAKNRSMLLSAIEDSDPTFNKGCIDLGIARDNEEDLNRKVMEGKKNSRKFQENSKKILSKF